MPKCEECKVEITWKNKSPSEIHDLCGDCWLKHPESKWFREQMSGVSNYIVKKHD